MDRNLAVAVARCGTIEVAGLFQRHVSPTVRTLTGSSSGGRWGAPGAYSVLYLGRPRGSVVVEAYRHLVDDVEGMTGDLVGPRRLLTVEVSLTSILDLRVPENQDAVGLNSADLLTPVGEYARCQRIGRVAHQLNLHGIIAPAATGLGETLAVFELHLPAAEQPTLLSEEEWLHLPQDPRALRSAESEDTPSAVD
jgi:RES domain